MWVAEKSCGGRMERKMCCPGTTVGPVDPLFWALAVAARDSGVQPLLTVDPGVRHPGTLRHPVLPSWELLPAAFQPSFSPATSQPCGSRPCPHGSLQPSKSCFWPLFPSLGLMLSLTQEHPDLLLSRRDGAERWVPHVLPNSSTGLNAKSLAEARRAVTASWIIYRSTPSTHLNFPSGRTWAHVCHPSYPCWCKFHPAHLAVWKPLWALMAAVPAVVLQQAWDQAETFTQEYDLVLDTTCLQRVELVWSQ